MFDALSRFGNDRAQIARLAASSGVFDEELALRGLCVTVLDTDGRLASINANGAKTLRMDKATVEAVRGRSYASLWPRDERKKVRDAVERARGGVPAYFTARVPDGADQDHWWDVELIPILEIDECPPAIIAVLNDVSRFKAAEMDLRRELADRDQMLRSMSRQMEDQTDLIRRLELQASQAEKLNSLGSFMGTVVHDINNLLSVMQSATRVMRRASDAPQMDTIQEEVERAVDKGRGMVRQLLDFARSDGSDTRPVRVGQVLLADADLMKRLVGEKVEVEIAAEDDGWAVLCESARISAVVFNLLSNARDAMPEGGTIKVGVTRCPASARPAGLAFGDYLRLSVEDEGTGMSAAVRDRLGEPFFTTKPEGVGTGIGVGTAFDLAKRCKGRVIFDSVEGRGTRVDVYLARSDLTVDEADAAPTPIVPAEHGGKSVLIVDGDAIMRTQLSLILSSLQYAVSGTESFAAARSRIGDGDKVDLLVVDLDSDTPAALAMVQDLQSQDPELSVVYLSSSPLSGERLDAQLLRKPVSTHLLAEAVLIALDRRPARHLSQAALTRATRLLDRLDDPGMRRAYAQWVEACGQAGALPDPALADTLRLEAPEAAYLMTCPAADTGAGTGADQSFTFVWAGTTLTTRLGRSLDGVAVESQDEESTGALQTALRRSQSGAAFFDFARMSFGEGQSTRFERLLMPLSADGQIVTHLLGFARFQDVEDTVEVPAEGVMNFAAPDLARRIEALDRAAIDSLPFGVIKIAAEGRIELYSATEARQSGRKKRPTLGLNLFTDVAPCMDTDIMRGRIQQAVARGRVDFELGWVGDFDDPEAEILIRVQSASDGGVWFFMNRDIR